MLHSADLSSSKRFYTLRRSSSRFCRNQHASRDAYWMLSLSLTSCSSLCASSASIYRCALPFDFAFDHLLITLAQRKAVVSPVIALRTDLVSSLHLNLFACASAFRSLRPLPQFLPSSRSALHALLEAVHTHLEDDTSASFDLIFAFAEAEILEELVEQVDLLVEITRRFFGTQTFLDDEVGEQSGIWDGWNKSRTGTARQSLADVQREQ